MANKTPILVFDLDDTLYSKQHVFLTALEKCYPTFSTDMDVYKVYQEKSEIAFELFTKGQITLEENHFSRVESTLSSLGLDSSKESVFRFKETYQYVMDHIELDKEWKDFFKLDALLIFLLATLPVGEKESDGDDSQGPRKFDNSCGFEGIGLVEAVPGAGGSRYRGSIIDRSPCKEGEAVIG